MVFLLCPEPKLKEPTLSKCKQFFDEQVARTKDDYKFSTAKDPLFNSTCICLVEDHCRQEHRCDCVRTDRKPKYAGAKLKRAVQKGLPGLFPSQKREMSVKGTECSELCGVVYVKPSVLKSHAGE